MVTSRVKFDFVVGLVKWCVNVYDLWFWADVHEE